MKNFLSAIALIFAKQISHIAEWCEKTFVKTHLKYNETAFAKDLSGSVGATNFSRNRSGPIMKKRALPINRNSTAQSLVRSLFTTLTQGWASLTNAQRATWNAAVNNFKKINSIANSISLTGHQLYISINRTLQEIGGVLLDNAPFPITVDGVLTASVVADVSTGIQTLTYTPAIPATDSWILEATRPMSAGRQSNSQDYKAIDVLLTANASPAVITAGYEVVYGGGWKTVGAKIFYRLHAVNTLTGVRVKEFNFSTIVVP